MRVAEPPRIWVVFLREGSYSAQFWSVLINHGETADNSRLRYFELEPSELLREFNNRL